MADAIERGEEIAGRLKADAAFAEFCAREDLGLQFVMLAKQQTLPYADLAAGPHQTLPVVGIGRKLARQQNFNAAVEESARRRIVPADGLSAGPFAPAVKSRRKNAGIVKDEKIIAPEAARGNLERCSPCSARNCAPNAASASHREQPGVPGR